MAPHYEHFSLSGPALNAEELLLRRESLRRQSLETQVQAILDREGSGIKVPKIKVHIALIEHGTEKDAENLRKDLNACDIFIPELVGASDEHVRELNDLSQGKISPQKLALKERTATKSRLRELYKRQFGTEPTEAQLDQHLDQATKAPGSMHGFNSTLRKLIHNSKKKIAHVDLVEGDNRRISESMNAIMLGPAVVRMGILSRLIPLPALSYLAREVAQEFGRTQREREDFMLDGIAVDIADFLMKDPELQKKPEVNVFGFLGAYHRGVPVALKGAGDAVSTHTVDSGKYFDHMMDAAQRSRFGEELTLDDGKRIVLGMIFELIYNHIDKRSTIFWKIHRYGSMSLVTRILADEFFDVADDVYKVFVTQRDSEKLITFFNQLVTSREASITKRVDEWVDKLKNFKEV